MTDETNKCSSDPATADSKAAHQSNHAFRFTLSTDEVRRFVRRFTRAPLWLRVVLIGLAFAFTAATAAIWLDAITNPIGVADFIFGLFLCLASVFLILWSAFASQIEVRIAMYRLRRADAEVFDNQELRLMPSGIESISRRTRMTFNWSGICDVHCEDDAIYFMLDKRTGFILPRRLLDSSNVSVEAILQDVAAWRQCSPPHERRCPKCGYDLRGQNETRCPECGWGRDEPGAADD